MSTSTCAFCDAFAEIASRLGVPIAGLSPEEASLRLVRAVDGLATEHLAAAEALGRSFHDEGERVADGICRLYGALEHAQVDKSQEHERYVDARERLIGVQAERDALRSRLDLRDAEFQAILRDNETLQEDLGEVLKRAREAWDAICAPVGAGVAVEPSLERERTATALFEILRRMGEIGQRKGA